VFGSFLFGNEYNGCAWHALLVVGQNIAPVRGSGYWDDITMGVTGASGCDILGAAGEQGPQGVQG
jgi:hypothetical protein